LVEQPLLLREVGSGTRTTFLLALGEALGAVPKLRRVTDLGSTSTILATGCVPGAEEAWSVPGRPHVRLQRVNSSSSASAT